MNASDFLSGGVSVGITGVGVWFILNRIMEVQRLFMNRYAAEITTLVAKVTTLQRDADQCHSLSFARGMAVVQAFSEIDDMRAQLNLPDRRAQHRALLTELELIHTMPPPPPPKNP